MLQPPQTGFGRTTNEYYHGNPAVEIRDDWRSVRHAGSRRLAHPPQGVRLHAERRGGRRAVRQEDSLHARDARVSPARHRRGCPDADGFLQGGTRRRRASMRESSADWSGFSPRQASCSASSASRGPATGLRVSARRPGSRVASVVLPLGQRAGRGTVEGGGSRKAEGSGVARAAGAAHAARSALEGAGGQLRHPVARAEQDCRARCPTPSCTRSSTRTSATRWSRRRSCLSRARFRRTGRSRSC